MMFHHQRNLPHTALLCLILLAMTSPARAQAADSQAAYLAQARPLIQKYCFACHSSEKHKGDIDLEHYTTLALIRKEVKPWQSMVEQLESEEMPPKGKPKPTDEERARLLAWVRGFLDTEAIARAGDPGYLPLRRLSNAEYNYTIRDLTGIDLQPTKEFPADGAGGEGFTNAAESLADMSPTLLNKYLLAAKELSAHVVLLPDGFRFSANKTRRDWTDESLASLRKFYARFSPPDGQLPLEPYLAATLRHRQELSSNPAAFESIAAGEKLSPKYLKILFQTLTNKDSSFPLDVIRAHWRSATEKDAPALAAEIANYQNQLWKIVPIGSYRKGNDSREQADNHSLAPIQTLRLALKSAPGQSDIVLYLSTQEIFPNVKAGAVLWGKPRLEAQKKPTLLLSEYPKFGALYEIDYPAAFADAAKYLNAVIAVRRGDQPVEEVAKFNHLDPARLKLWIRYLNFEPLGKKQADPVLKTVPPQPLELLSEKTPANPDRPAISGWHNKGNDLPAFLSNSSDTEEHIPGRASPHKIVVHPLPREFVAVAWKSPIDGNLLITAHIAHAHPNCGNGVAYWLEHRHESNRAGVLAEGQIELGGQASIPPKTIAIAKGDQIVLAIDAKNGDHSCDLTQIDLTLSAGEQKWDLASDIAGNIQAGNPHPDVLGNAGVWSFVKGPSRPVDKGSAAPLIPANSLVAQWREAAIDPARQADSQKLATQVESLLTHARPAKETDPNRLLYESLINPESPLLQGLDLSTLPRQKETAPPYALDAARFGKDAAGQPIDPGSFTALSNSVTEIRLPAALARDREFVVEASLAAPSPDRSAQFSLSTTPPRAAAAPSIRQLTLAATPDNDAQKQIQKGLDDFRAVFPLFTCFPHIVPVDEVVCLKMFHRDDEPLIRLFLNEGQHRQLESLWKEHTFITQQPIAENKYLPLFIGFVTQDGGKDAVAYYESLRQPFRQRADAFEKELEAAVPLQLSQLADFAARAYRRPLRDAEKAELNSLYQALRAKGLGRDDAFQSVLARVFVAPSFLFKIETAPPGKAAGPVNDYELATRLSYFLWSRLPDEELRTLAAQGKLHDPAVLAQQTRRMLKDPRTRALGLEFGAQWIHLRDFETYKEKSETQFPQFNNALRAAMYEETILFFQNLFQNDRPIDDLLNADYTYLNDTLAKHYNILGVTGPQWRKVDGVKKFGRGGILALAAVQTKEAAAARTSPILRGNWVLETLLDEKLPRPPPNVPQLPEAEGATNGLTTRELVQKHTTSPSCAACHQRIDPIGFSFERYDAIGRLRDKESSGLPINCRATLKDGTQFEGLDGLRNYLTKKKQEIITRLFCRRLLGYALGRSVTLSDQKLVNEMVSTLKQNGGHLDAAVQTIVASPQFRMIRGSGYSDDE
jgi:mono/diheme cytochrome c family protein